MALDDVFDPLYENMLHIPEDSNTSNMNGEENKEISEVRPCDEQDEDGATEEQPCNIFDAIQFTLLHSLGFYRRNMLDHLIQELVKFFGKQSIFLWSK
jgi:hypothetical protein